MSAVMVAGRDARKRAKIERDRCLELRAKREADEAENAAWRARHRLEQAQEQAELRSRLSAKQHAAARRLGEERLLELRRLMLEFEPALAAFERGMRAVCRFEADVYAEFQKKYGNDVGEQLFEDYVGHRVTGEIRDRVEKASQ